MCLPETLKSLEAAISRRDIFKRGVVARRRGSRFDISPYRRYSGRCSRMMPSLP